MHFQKQDLEGSNYYWTEDVKEILTGQPSRRSFDRCNGNQMLFLINFYGALSERFTLLEGKKMEKIILDDLPAEAKSELSVFNWIRNHLAI